MSHLYVGIFLSEKQNRNGNQGEAEDYNCHYLRKREYTDRTNGVTITKVFQKESAKGVYGPIQPEEKTCW